MNRIAEDLATILFGENYELPTVHSEVLIDLDPAVLDAYVGEYEMAQSGMVLTARREGGRFLLHLRTPTEQTTMELYPVSETLRSSLSGTRQE